MKNFLAILVLSLCFINPSHADNIRDFKIEGMSIGESILKYYDKETIKLRTANWPNSKRYVYFFDDDFKTSTLYEGLQLVYLSNDSNYTIKGIVAGILYKDSINACYDKKLEVFEELKLLFPNTKIEKTKKLKHRADSSGKSTLKSIYFRFNNGDTVGVSCYDWSEKMRKEKGWLDHLRVVIYVNDYKSFLRNEAYKKHK